MTDVTIESVSAGDVTRALVCDDILRRAYSAGRRHVWWSPPQAVEERVRDPKPGRRVVRLIAVLDGVDVGAADASFAPGEPAGIELGVLPEARRRGIGSALAERLRAELGDGAALAQTEVYLPDGEAFARSQGLTLGNREHRLLLELTPERRRELSSVEAAVADDVTLDSWVGACPERFLDVWARLHVEMHEDVPLGTMTRSTPPTPESLHQNDVRMAAAGYRLVRTLARRGEEPLGYTEMILSSSDPALVAQEDTLVARAARGQGLGRALKLANLRHLVTLPEADGARRVQTYTATSNTAMLALNASLGFETVDTMSDMEGPIQRG